MLIVLCNVIKKDISIIYSSNPPAAGVGGLVVGCRRTEVEKAGGEGAESVGSRDST